MALKDIIETLSKVSDSPCVTISFNTFKTYPDNEKNAINLKNLVKEAGNRIISEFGKRESAEILEKLDSISDELANIALLESIHIFISKDVEEIVASPWPTNSDAVFIDDTFATRPLIKAMNRIKEYLILTIAQGGAHLYQALNDGIENEISEEGFPFPENTLDLTGFDNNKIENRRKEYFNQVDKAVVAVYNKNNLDVVVLSTEPNYAMLMEVADRPTIYIGHDTQNSDRSDSTNLANQAFEIIKELQKEERLAAIEELKAAVASGQVITDLQDIYQAAIDGRGELLVVQQDFEQAVKMTSDRTFEIADDAKEHDVVDDIVSTIAWEVISKGGKAHFTSQEELNELGKIVLKVRY